MTKLRWLIGCIVAVGVAAVGQGAMAKDTMRLEWIMQGQFAGFIVAYDKGYYKQAGADIELVPAGPDIKPAVVVAQGADTFGLGHPNQVITARSNDVPLVSIFQFGQDSASVYISRKEKGINSVKDMPGHSVGLWFGGDEHEFLAMMSTAGVKPDEVKIIPQGYDIVQWLRGGYDVMQVTQFNELLTVYDQGVGPDQLNVMRPRDYGVAMISGGLFTTEKTIKDRPELVQAVVSASMRGWKEALEDPEAAAKIVLKYNSELKLPHQIAQIKAMGKLICVGPTLDGKFGYSDKKDYEVAQKVLLDAKLMSKPVDLDQAFTNKFWEAVPAEYKKVKCD
jgi:NitT/TauT family transport system substrate-binding protein